MDADLIERLARDAGVTEAGISQPGAMRALKRFAAAVGEECAKVCEEEAVDAASTGDSGDEAYNAALTHAAAAIRAKFKAG